MTTVRVRPHESLRAYMAAETAPTSYYGNCPSSSSRT